MQEDKYEVVSPGDRTTEALKGLVNSIFHDTRRLTFVFSIRGPQSAKDDSLLTYMTGMVRSIQKHRFDINVNTHHVVFFFDRSFRIPRSGLTVWEEACISVLTSPNEDCFHSRFQNSVTGDTVFTNFKWNFIAGCYFNTPKVLAAFVGKFEKSKMPIVELGGYIPK